MDDDRRKRPPSEGVRIIGADETAEGRDVPAGGAPARQGGGGRGPAPAPGGPAGGDNWDEGWADTEWMADDDSKDDSDDYGDDDENDGDVGAGADADVAVSDTASGAGHSTSHPTGRATGDAAAQLPHWSEPAGGAVAGSGAEDDTGGWSTFAGQGPRWRDQPGDWHDVDFDDPSTLGDDSVKVGALDPDRAGAAARISFEDDDLAFLSDEAERAAEELEGSGATAGVGARSGTLRIGTPPVGEDAGRGVDTGADPRRSGGRGRRGDDRAAPSPSVPGRAAPSPPSGGRDLGTAVGTGVLLLGAVLLVFTVGKSRGVATLVCVALAFAVMELFQALRQRAFHPAILVGVVATVALGFTAYRQGAGGILITLLLTMLTSMLWYLFRIEPDRPAVNIAVTLLGVLYIGGLGSTANLILRMPDQDGLGVLAGAILGTVGYDVLGYLLGSRIGKRPLAPEVSPNKTVEGLIAGMAGAFFTCVIVFGMFEIHPWNLKKAVALGLVVAIAAPLGDLAESMLKRDLGIKDMSTMLPGHGGVLDRIDALLFVVPAVYFLSVILNFV